MIACMRRDFFLSRRMYISMLNLFIYLYLYKRVRLHLPPVKSDALAGVQLVSPASFCQASAHIHKTPELLFTLS